MSKGCIFVGGVHGSGKTELCKKIQEKIECVYLSASQLLRWSKKEKNVENVQENQRILKELLKKEMQDDKLYLIDGHFALWNEQYQIEKVSLDFFIDLHLQFVICTIADAVEIQKRILKRDENVIMTDKIISMQNVELNHAEFISKVLDVPLYVIDSLQNDVIQSLNAIIKGKK